MPEGLILGRPFNPLQPGHLVAQRRILLGQPRHLGHQLADQPPELRRRETFNIQLNHNYCGLKIPKIQSLPGISLRLRSKRPSPCQGAMSRVRSVVEMVSGSVARRPPVMDSARAWSAFSAASERSSSASTEPR